MPAREMGQRMAGAMYVAVLLALLAIVVQLPQTGAADSDGLPHDVDDNTILKAIEEAKVKVDAEFQAKIRLKLLAESSARPGEGAGSSTGTLAAGDAAGPSEGTASPADFMGIFREPAGETREALQVGETWQDISRRLNIGGVEDKDGKFNLTVNLSQNQIQMISQKIERRPAPACRKDDVYRSITGACNNRKNPGLGAANKAFGRWLPAQYEDGVQMPQGWTPGKPHNGVPLPQVRDVSNKIARSLEKNVVLDKELNQLFMVWGQWITHDMDFSPQGLVPGCRRTGCTNEGNSFPVQIPPNDPTDNNQRQCMQFTRTGPAPPTNSVVRQQLNGVTNFIDASDLYGSEDCQAKMLRDTKSPLGLLKVNTQVNDDGRAFLPFVDEVENLCPIGVSCSSSNPCPLRNLQKNVSCFLGGDRRLNLHLAFMAVNTLFVREHNRLARELKKINPHWGSERLYQEARKIVIAQTQIITYRNYLPYFLGENTQKELPLYDTYNEKEDPRIANVFSIAFRAAHGTIPPFVFRLNSQYKVIDETRFHKTLFSTWIAVKEGGFDPIIRGILVNGAKLVTQDAILSDEVRDKLFAQSDSALGVDLGAIDMQRSRDHGLPRYNAWRKFCGLSQPRNLDELASVMKNKGLAKKLLELYKIPDNIDLWIAAITEPLVKKGRVGPVLACIIGRQFRKVRDGDRFWWQNAGVFSKEQRTALSTISLSRFICDNSGLTKIPMNAFADNKYPRDFVDCNTIKKLDLSAWADTKKLEAEQPIRADL